MTGRYNLRTGIRDTYNGGAMMASSEVTIAEMLKEVNYTTGIFGKWHLGDNYPSRPMDQGFDESVIHLVWRHGTGG
jgi:arylsulfatase A-like enzyme